VFPALPRPNLDELFAGYARLALDDVKALIIPAEVP